MKNIITVILLALAIIMIIYSIQTDFLGQAFLRFIVWLGE